MCDDVTNTSSFGAAAEKNVLESWKHQVSVVRPWEWKLREIDQNALQLNAPAASGDFQQNTDGDSDDTCRDGFQVSTFTRLVVALKLRLVILEKTSTQIDWVNPSFIYTRSLLVQLRLESPVNLHVFGPPQENE